jgi:hypothetical protein
MTDHTELIATLSSYSRGDPADIVWKAADTIEAQAAEIKQLEESERDSLKAQAEVNAFNDFVIGERNEQVAALQAEVDRITTLARGQHIKLYNARLRLDAIEEPVADDIVAGALYDFLGYLTTRSARVAMSARDEAGPAVDALIAWSKTRRINLVEARVKDWNLFTAAPVAQAIKQALPEPVKHTDGLVEILNEAAAVIDKVRDQEPQAWEKFGLRDYLVDELQGSALILKDAQQVQPERALLKTRAEECRGYALLGTGQYCINHTLDFHPELGAELIITLSTDADKSDNRQVGESRDNPEPGKPIQPEEMVIRIGFLSERGLFALEDQLAWIRRLHFPDAHGIKQGGQQ